MITRLEYIQREFRVFRLIIILADTNNPLKQLATNEFGQYATPFKFAMYIKDM